MSAPAAVVVPTRDRPEYLEVALASLAPQVRAAGAELVVVDDGTGAETAVVAARHGAVHVPAPAPGGVNRARNAGIEATSAPLVVFCDDDVEARPGWFDALLGAAAAHPEHEVFGGRLEVRLEGGRLRPCGREGPPVTFLDLGDEDRETELVWGANLAIRRSAFARVGPFDPARSGSGDEEEWERRLRARGGRILYVAGARLVHRRAREDATLPALARSAYVRGRQARNFDAERGAAPGAAAEAHILVRCLGHAARRRCGTGLVLGAHSAGRLQEALRA